MLILGEVVSAAAPADVFTLNVKFEIDQFEFPASSKARQFQEYVELSVKFRLKIVSFLIPEIFIV